MDENDSFDYYDDIEAHIILKTKKLLMSKVKGMELWKGKRK